MVRRTQEEFLAFSINEILPDKYQGIPEEFVAKQLTKRGNLIDISLTSRNIQLEGRPARIVVAAQD